MKYSDLNLRVSSRNEPTPYQLLLQADESINAINKYIYKCEIYLVRSGENTVGVCAIQEIDAYSIEIKNLSISQKYRNCVIGTRGLQKIEAIYPDKNILVGTGDGSKDALRFYKKNGFKQHAVRKNFFLNNYGHPNYRKWNTTLGSNCIVEK